MVEKGVFERGNRGLKNPLKKKKKKISTDPCVGEGGRTTTIRPPANRVRRQQYNVMCILYDRAGRFPGRYARNDTISFYW